MLVNSSVEGRPQHLHLKTAQYGINVSTNLSEEFGQAEVTVLVIQDWGAKYLPLPFINL